MSDSTWRRAFQPIRANPQADIDAEMRLHVELLVEQLVAEGRTPEDARAEAERRFGAAAPIHDACVRIDQRRARRLALGDTLGNFAQDLRFGARMLRRSPGFAATAILCLTLAIGANASVYSWLEGVLLRPYPLVAAQDHLFALVGTTRGEAGHTGTSWPDFIDLRQRSTKIEAFIANNISGTVLGTGDRAQRVPVGIVSANYWTAIGVRPVMGRGFEPDEEVGRNAHPVAVISHQLWRERFRGDSATIGTALVINGVPHTIVGVAPEGFTGTFVGYVFHVWVPVSQEEVLNPTGYKLEDRRIPWVEGMVRLKPGVSVGEAETELAAIAGQLERDYPNTNRGRTLALAPLYRNPFNAAAALYPALRIALVMVTLVLLIACANVGNLLLVRAFARRREMMVRLAIGAERLRLVRQLVTEGLILSVIAAAGGVLVAYWSRHALLVFYPSTGGTTFNFPGTVDWRVLGASAAACIVSTILFALVPAMRSSKVDLAAAIKSESAVGGAGRGRGWLRSGLVLVQVALSFFLLAGAGLLLRSLQAIHRTDPGFTIDHILVSSINLTGAGYDTARARVVEDALLQRVRAIPGVEGAAYARVTPFSVRPYSLASIAVDGYVSPPGQQATAQFDEVSDGFLATMGMGLAVGREFTRDDDEHAGLVSMVNETMGARYWNGRSPVGERLQVNGKWTTVVGVVRNARYSSFLESPKAMFYVPLRQHFSALLPIHLRTALAPEAAAPALVKEIHAVDPGLAPGVVLPMREIVNRTLSAQRAAVTLLEVFAAVALLLASVGLYGVMSYATSQGTREFGLRMALGAAPTSVLRLVVTRGVVLGGAGVALGAAASPGLNGILADLLYQVSPRDPLTLTAVGGIVLATTALASWLPARRAASIDPVGALRGD